MPRRNVAALCTLLLGVCLAGEARPARVEVASNGDGFVLLRDGAPYVVKGAGGATDLASVAASGGNSVRTWGIEGAEALLDSAAEHGLTVAMGLPVAGERFGMDYGSAAAVDDQRARVAAAVRALKDHSALLFWIVGNELNHGMRSPRVYDEVNALSELIHRIDPYHPTTTAVTAGFEPLELVLERAPDLDFVSIQLYAAMALMPQYADEWLAGRPFMVTEWGPIGHWEAARTAWGAPVEMDSTAKAERYLNDYRELIEPHLGQALGSYVFLWGQKQERTPTWYSMFTERGEPTAAVDAMQMAWTGAWPGNRAPAVTSMLLDGRSAADDVALAAGRAYAASLAAHDPDGDALSYRWSIKPESAATQEGGDYEAPVGDMAGLIEDATASAIALTAPDASGAYRLFAYVYDSKGSAGHANVPFRVQEATR